MLGELLESSWPIPRATLSAILMNYLDPKSAQDRLRLVRLYIQSERYEDARGELETALKLFDELAELKNQVKQLRQNSARQLIDELKRRQAAGQFSGFFIQCLNLGLVRQQAML